MKISKIAIVSIILLAILTLGAVSASDNTDNLTVSNDDIMSSIDDNIVADVDDDSGGDDDDIDDEYEDDDGEDDDYYDVTLYNTVYNDDEDDYAVEYYFDSAFEGTVAVILDDHEAYNRTIATNDYIYVTVEDLGIGDLAYGSYPIEFIYSGDENHPGFSESGTLEVTYRFNAYLDDMYDYGYIPYGQNVYYTISLPSEANGSIVYYVNGKQYSENVENLDNIRINSQDIVYGNNNVTFQYVGGDYPLRTIEKSFNTISVVEFSRKITYEDALIVTITLPDDVVGNLEVYELFKTFSYDEYDDEIYSPTFTLLNSAKVENGIANVIISNLSVGRHYIYANFTGDYDILLEGEWNNINDPDYDIEVSVYPKFTVPDTVWINGTYTGEFKLPNGFNGELEITIGEETRTFDVIEGSGTFDLFNLNYTEDYEEDEGNRWLRVYYSYMDNVSDYEVSDSQSVYVILANPQTQIKVDDEYRYYDAIVKNHGSYSASLYLPGITDGIVVVYIDDEYYDTLDFDGSVYLDIDIDNLTFGKHDVRFEYLNGSYFKPSTAYDSFNVSYIVCQVPDYVYIGKSYGSASTVLVLLSDDATGEVKLIIDGVENSTQQVEDGSAIFGLSNLSYGNHTIALVYQNGNYPSVTKTYDVVAKYPYFFEFGDLIYGSGDAYSEMPEGATGVLTATIDGKQFSAAIDDKGIARFNITGIPAGEYEVTITYSGDDTYPADSSTFNITIEYRFVDNFEYDDVIYVGDLANKIISLILPDNATGKLVVYWDEEDLTELASKNLVNGKAQISLEEVFDGINAVDRSFDLEIRYVGEDYKVSSQSRWIEINSYKVTQPKNSGNIILGETVKYTVQLPESVTGYLKVLTGKNYNTVMLDNINIENGAAIISFEASTLGLQSFKFVYVGNDYKFSEEYNILVWPENSTLAEKASGDDNLFTVQMPSDASGNLTLHIYDYKYDTSLTINATYNGSIAAVKASEIPNGNWVLNYFEIDDEKYGFFSFTSSGKWWGEGAYGNFEITGSQPPVILIDPNLSVSAGDINVGDAATVNIVLNQTFNGEVSLTVNNKNYTVNVVNGKGSQAISNLAAGSYYATATFVGNDVFSKAQSTASFNVNKLAPTITINSLDRIVEGSALAVNVAVPSATGTVIINGKEYTLVNGAADMTISNVETGELNISVSYNGDDKYLSGSNSKTVTVYAKVSPKLQITVSDINVGQTAVVNVAIDSKATGVVTVNGNAVTITNGKGTLSLSNLEAGEYEVIAVYAGDAEFNAENASASFKVNNVTIDPKVTVKATTALYLADGKFQATVYGSDGKLAKGVDVIFTISGKQVGKATTNANGVAAYTVKSNLGTYTVTAKALGVSASAKLTVKHLVTLKSVTVKKSAKSLVLQATLAKVNGKYLKNKQVTFKFNGKTYKAKTSSKGVAKVTIKSNVLKKLKVGKTITYQASYSKDTVKKSVKVKK